MNQRRSPPVAALLGPLFFAALLASAPSLLTAANITAVWANSGEDKVTQNELRTVTGGAGVLNSVWDGSRINLFGGRNETVAFNVILEARANAASGVTVTFNRLDGPGGAAITAAPASGDGVFDWTQRSIELFYVRYLKIKGLSKMSYETYDERHIPKRMQRPWSGNGAGSGTWLNRPDHDKYYPDIAVPLELVPSFPIAAGANQSVWVDVTIPKTADSGLYTGTLVVQEGGTVVGSIPVQLKVYDFTLPDTPAAKTMLYYSSENINKRYLGATYIDPASAQGRQSKVLRDRHFLLAHRHRLSLIGDSLNDCAAPGDQPCPDWQARLDGSLFTSANGYAGPGMNVGNNVYSIGTYGSWNWKTGGQPGMNQHTDAWVNWFTAHAPATEYFLYLIDESTDTAQIETWSQWIRNDPGPGHLLKSMATIALPTGAAQTPSLDIPVSTLEVGLPSQWQPEADLYTNDARKRFFMYNGHRPATASFATEDDGIALRELAWAQYKKHINRWFFWESTYYNNYQGGMGETNVFQTAQTFGSKGAVDGVLGETGWNYSNGDGVLFYPGTDTVYPADSYGVNGPFASLRLKAWRRGVEDVDYLALAAAVDPAQVQAIVNQMVPKALWEYGVNDINDPTYVLTDVSWSNDPQLWEAARLQLANIITSGGNTPPPPAGDTSPPQAPSGVYFNYPMANSLRLNWNAAVDNVGVAGYRIDLALDAAFNNKVPTYADLDVGNNLLLALSGLQAGTSYYGRVRAYDATGNLSTYSATAQMQTLSSNCAAQSAPTNLTLGNPTLNTLSGAWAPSTSTAAFSVSSYQVQVSTMASFADFLANPWNGYFYTYQYTSGDFSGLQPGTKYYARVRAIDASGNTSNYSPTAAASTKTNIVAPPPPSTVAFRYPNVTTLRLYWSSSTANAVVTGYRMDLATNASFGAKVAGFVDKDLGNALSINLDGLSAGTTYYAQVRAYDAQGNVSGNSATAQMRTFDANYASANAPAKVTLSVPTRTTAQFAWTGSKSIGGFTVATYQVQVSRSANFTEFISNPWNGSFYAQPATTASLTGLLANTRYYARVRAVDSYGNTSNYGPVASVLLPK